MSNKQTRRVTKLSGQDRSAVINFFSSALNDYLAARHLLINNFLLQGCILANTAIEKYFKGLKAILREDIPRHHDITVRKFKGTLSNKYKRLHDLINFDFLELLKTAYEYRYPDEMPIGSHITIIQSKTLAELDFVVGSIEESIQIKDSSKAEVNRKYTHLKDTSDPTLTNNNYFLLGIDKSSFITKQCLVYESQKDNYGRFLEITYPTDQVINDNKFLYSPILTQEGGKSSAKLSFTPITNQTE